MPANHPFDAPFDPERGGSPTLPPQTGSFHPQPGIRSEAATLSPGATPGSGPVQIPGFDILGELGRGGMGVVYKARQTGLNRLVAIKVILSGSHASAQEQARFRTEAEAIARLHHPNVVQIHHIGEHEGKPFIALEFVEGSTLAEELKGQPWSARLAATMMQELARTMQAVHEQGIVHRDLKPGNIMLTVDGEPKITDFGLAKQLDANSGRTASGAILGTPSYMAPEQAGGRGKEVGPATDIYALGAILYELLTGRPPFKAETPLETILQVVTEPVTPPHEVRAQLPPDLETICLRCLEKKPEDRYRDAEALAEDLRCFLNDEPLQPRFDTAASQFHQWFREYAGTKIILAIALIYMTLAVIADVYRNTYVAIPLTLSAMAMFLLPRVKGVIYLGIAVLAAMFVLHVSLKVLLDKPPEVPRDEIFRLVASLNAKETPDRFSVTLRLAFFEGSLLVLRGLLMGAAGWLIARWTGKQRFVLVLGAFLGFGLGYRLVALTLLPLFQPSDIRVQMSSNPQANAIAAIRPQVNEMFALPDIMNTYYQQRLLANIRELHAEQSRQNQLSLELAWFTRLVKTGLTGTLPALSLHVLAPSWFDLLRPVPFLLCCALLPVGLGALLASLAAEKTRYPASRAEKKNAAGACASGVLLLVGLAFVDYWTTEQPQFAPQDNPFKGMMARPTARKPTPEEEEATLKATGRNKMNRIAMAMRAYQKAHKSMPPAAIYDKNGKPLLSWRVALLPHFGQQKLYDQFKLDEPWDSPHNKALLASMPELFRMAGTGAAKSSQATHYRIFVSPRAAAPQTCAAFQEGTTLSFGQLYDMDGLDGTILFVEADKAVPWTKPEELVYDPAEKLPALGGLFKDGCHITFASGETRYYKHETLQAYEHFLRASITRHGGEDRDLSYSGLGR